MGRDRWCRHTLAASLETSFNTSYLKELGAATLGKRDRLRNFRILPCVDDGLVVGQRLAKYRFAPGVGPLAHPMGRMLRGNVVIQVVRMLLYVIAHLEHRYPLATDMLNGKPALYVCHAKPVGVALHLERHLPELFIRVYQLRPAPRAIPRRYVILGATLRTLLIAPLVAALRVVAGYQHLALTATPIVGRQRLAFGYLDTLSGKIHKVALRVDAVALVILACAELVNVVA